MLSIAAERERPDGEANVVFRRGTGLIHADLRLGADVTAVQSLAANAGLCGQGVKVVGDGFYVPDDFVSSAVSPTTRASLVRHLINTRDVLEGRAGRRIIDFFGLSADDAKRLDPKSFQQALTRVKPMRDQNKRKSIRELWWRFAWERPVVRGAIRDLPRYLVTLSTSKHRFFVFLPADVLWDGALFAIALEDSALMGVLSSRLHGVWAAAAGGRIGVGNDLTWTNKTCFDPFPFPAPTPAQSSRIRSLGESLDAHRKRQQALHPGLTITGMYNVLEKLRSGEALIAKEKVIHEEGLVSVLKQIHDDLDAEVFDAYGWPSTLTDEEILERLVALNAERAEEEKRGLVRWLRPEFQNPGGAKAATQEALPSTDDDEEEPAAKAAAPLPWPKPLPERIAAVRDLMARGGGARSLATVTSAFAKAKPKDVEPVLESLASLGLLVSFDGPEGRLWRAGARA